MESDSEEKFRDKQFSIDVDSSLEDVLIVLSAEADPGITLLNPTGKIQCGFFISGKCRL